MKFLILGVGFLGSKLLNDLSDNFDAIGADIKPKNIVVKKIDATIPLEIENFLMQEAPDVVINTIALSSYYACEKDPGLCRKLNFESAKNIAKACRKVNAKMVFISSSYVFDGSKGEYLETDVPNATTQYALSKIDAEKEVLKLNNSVVLRFEPIYGIDVYSKNIVFGTNTFQSEVNVAFPNLLRRPIFINDVASIITLLIRKNKQGIFNVAGGSTLKWLNFLNHLASLENTEDKIKTVDNASWMLSPPYNTSLNTEKIILLGAKITGFQQALKIIKKEDSF